MESLGLSATPKNRSKKAWLTLDVLKCSLHVQWCVVMARFVFDDESMCLVRSLTWNLMVSSLKGSK